MKLAAVETSEAIRSVWINREWEWRNPSLNWNIPRYVETRMIQEWTTKTWCPLEPDLGFLTLCMTCVENTRRYIQKSKGRRPFLSLNVNYASYSSEDCHSVWVRANATCPFLVFHDRLPTRSVLTRYISWLTGHKEGPSAICPASLRQLLEIKHFPNRIAPQW